MSRLSDELQNLKSLSLNFKPNIIKLGPMNKATKKKNMTRARTTHKYLRG